MTPADRTASEAKRLLNEPLLVEALDGIMADAFAEFKTIELSPETLPAAIKLQALANAAHEIHDRIYAHILAGGELDGGMVVEAKPSA